MSILSNDIEDPSLNLAPNGSPRRNRNERNAVKKRSLSIADENNR